MRNGGGARKGLLGGNRETAELARELDRLVRVAGRGRDARSMRNFSGTARVGIMATGLCSMGQDAAQGDWGRVGTSVLAGLLVPRLGAQLLTNPEVVRCLAYTAAKVDRHVRGWEKASDHAPTWIELAEEGSRKQAPPARRSRKARTQSR